MDTTIITGTRTMDTDVKARMSADEFIAWAMEQPETEHYELHDGEIVSMSAERSLHGLVKGNVFLRVTNALAQAALPCWTYIDSMAVAVGETTVFEPDIVVRCGEKLADNAVKITDPLLVVEVLSPSTRIRDLNTKLAGYLRIASLRHYLIVDPEARRIVHHARAGADRFSTMILGDQSITLDPPGIVLENIFA